MQITIVAMMYDIHTNTINIVIYDNNDNTYIYAYSRLKQFPFAAPARGEGPNPVEVHPRGDSHARAGREESEEETGNQSCTTTGSETGEKGPH